MMMETNALPKEKVKQPVRFFKADALKLKSMHSKERDKILGQSLTVGEILNAVDREMSNIMRPVKHSYFALVWDRLKIALDDARQIYEDRMSQVILELSGAEIE
jgi:hypothetical protein